MGEFEKFPDYTLATFDLGSSQTNDLLNAGKFIANLNRANSAQADSNALPIKMPKTEIQVRALREVDEAYRLECWKGIVAHRDPENLTANNVRAEVKLFLDRKGHQPKKNKVRPNCLGRINDKISELDEVLKKHPNRELFEPLIQQLKMLVNPETEIEVLPADSDAIPDSEIEPGDPGHRQSMAAVWGSPVASEDTAQAPSEDSVAEPAH